MHGYLSNGYLRRGLHLEIFDPSRRLIEPRIWIYAGCRCMFTRSIFVSFILLSSPTSCFLAQVATEILMMHNLLSFILSSRRSCRYNLFWSLVYGLWMDFLFYKALSLLLYYYFHNLITLLICLSVC